MEDAPARRAPAVPAEEAAPAVEPAAEESARPRLRKTLLPMREVSWILLLTRLQAAVDYLTPFLS